jgi:uncharacterized protein
MKNAHLFIKRKRMDYTKYFQTAKEIYKDEPSGHDFSHIERVLKACKIMQAQEGGDEFLLTISALFHDVHRVLSNKQGKFVSAKESIPFVRDVLKSLGLKGENLSKILYLIEMHDKKDLKEDTPIELKILQDADTLDALGEIGLSRTLTYCKNKNIPIFDNRYSLDCKEYVPDIFPISTTHYVQRTMIPRAQMLKTKTGKKLGEDKVLVLQKFVDENVKNNK